LSAVRQPLRFQPRIHSVMPLRKILAVGMEAHLDRPLQALQRHDRRHQLHAVVGGQPLATVDVLLVLAVTQHHAPAARSGIAAARVVGEDIDTFSADRTVVDCSFIGRTLGQRPDAARRPLDDGIRVEGDNATSLQYKGDFLMHGVVSQSRQGEPR
jgi:hypothetical protein